MTFITKKALPRRTFLRGMGTAMALPFLDAMIPALSAAPKPVARMGWLYTGNGIIQNQFIPAQTGTSFELPPILKPLSNLRSYVNVVSGLQHKQADTQGDGTGDHPRAAAAWLTGVHARDRSQPGVEVRLATTADQWAAREIGKSTQLPSMELTVDHPSQGACDAGDCFFVNTISWRNESTPNMPEDHPRVVFERLFGDGGTTAQRQARAKNSGSLLDSVAGEANRLSQSLGSNDRNKLGEYLDSVRELEARIGSAETQGGGESLELPDRPVGIPDSFDEYVNMMFDLQVLALRTDITRVFTFILAREISNRAYPQIGVPEAHHGVSHHRDDPALVAKKARIDTYHVQLLARLAEKMQKTPDVEGSLLDNSLIMHGGGLGNGNLHRHQNLPCLLVGNQGGKLKGGHHLSFPDQPMSNLLLAILDKSGVSIDKLGDSTGRLPIEPLTLPA